MLARVAENIYWLNRYFERAESTARLINAHSNLLMDLPSVDDHDGWLPLVSINGQDDEFLKKFSSADEHNVIHFLVTDKSNTGSLVNAFSAIQGNLRSCRDIVPKNVYEDINSLCRTVFDISDDIVSTPSHRHEFLRQVERRLQAIANGLNCNMYHDLGYLIMRMACYIERADMTSRIIDVQSTRLTAKDTPRELMAIEAQRWVSVLRTLSASQMYRQHVKRPVSGPDTLAFLLTNTRLPRSYTFCLQHLAQCVKSLKQSGNIVDAIDVQQEKLNSANFTSLSKDPTALHDFLDDLQLGMLEVNAEIYKTYFPPIQDSE